MEEVGAGVEQGEEREEGRDGKKKKNRCLSCKKKVGLTGERPFHLVTFLASASVLLPETSGSRIQDGKGPRFGIIITDYISESLVTIIWVINAYIFFFFN